MAYQVKTEKLISRPASDVFRALSEGRLFMNCGADSRIMEIDFRVGGKYKIQFRNKTLVNFGEFLEIVENQRIAFSWCQTFGVDQKPDTQVTIELFADGEKTRLSLLHTGFKDQETCAGHEKGWFDGINDLTNEIENGTLRMVRSFNAPVEKLFETFKDPATYAAQTGGRKGDTLESAPNKKMVLAWKPARSASSGVSKVTLTFTQREGGVSAVELIHDGLSTDEDQKAHRRGWEAVTEKMLSVI